MKIEKLPGCVAQYDLTDGVCNGNKDDPDPCPLRDLCAAFKQHLEDNDEKREEYLNIYDHAENEDGECYCMAAEATNDELVEAFKELVKTYGIKDGKVTCLSRKEKDPNKEKTFSDALQKNNEKENKSVEICDKQKSKKASKNRTKVKKFKYKKSRERNDKMREIFDSFMANLFEQLGKDRMIKGKELVIPGKIYISDRWANGYVSVYCRTAKGRDIALVMLLPKPRSMTMDVKMAIEPKVFSKILSKNAANKFGVIIAISEGKFKSRMNGFGVEKLSILAESIGKAVKDKLIELPKA